VTERRELLRLENLRSEGHRSATSRRTRGGGSAATQSPTPDERTRFVEEATRRDATRRRRQTGRPWYRPPSARELIELRRQASSARERRTEAAAVA